MIAGRAARVDAAHRDRTLSLLILAALLVVVALTGPSLPRPRPVYTYLFVIDITQSMNVVDVAESGHPVSRLEQARTAVRTAVEQLPCGSKAALAIFTEYRAFLLFAPVEVCEHYSALAAMLGEVDWTLAWAARSEVAKGLYSSLLAARELGEQTRLVFLTDGHEAPPINPQVRPRFTGAPGEVLGVVVGVGGDTPAPIPHFGPDGELRGYWRAEEVMQVDPFSIGRPSTVAGETMAGIDVVDVAERIATGREHLSSLREPYLRQLAGQTGLAYHRLQSTAGLLRFLQREQFARTQRQPTDLRWIAGGLAILVMVSIYLHQAGLSPRSLARRFVPALTALLLLPGGLLGDEPAQARLSRAQVEAQLESESADFTGADLRGLDLSGLDFRGVNLQGADLSRASLRRCNLDLAILRSATLVEADLRDTSLFSTVLADANLRGADLRGARLVANLTGADLENALLTDIEAGADMRNQPMGLMRTTLAQARLKGAQLAGANLSRADLRFADLRQADLSRANLMGAELSGADLRGAELAGATFSGADIEHADFSGATGLQRARGLEATVGRESATFDR